MRDTRSRHAAGVSIALAATLLLIGGCSRSGDEKAASAPASETVAQQAPAAAPAPEAPPPPPTEEAANWSPEGLDEITAPIALYPDPILAQVLSAATDPQQVMDAGNWLIDNAALKDQALTKAVSEAGFTPSVQALVHFPTVMDMMCREIDWTRQLGEAFDANQAAVLDSVQRLRRQAKDAGTLASSPQMTVQQTVQQEKDVIVIQPADPKVVYVPQYEPSQAYAPVAAPAPAPAPAPATASATDSSGISTREAVMGGLLAFGAGVLVANIFDDDDDHDNNDYWYGHGYPNWGYGGVYYGPRPYYPHNTFIYAPRYPNYRPQHYYRPPANYPYHYRGDMARQASVRGASSPAYFNRFEQNRNRMEGYKPRSPASGQPGKPVAAYRGEASPRIGATKGAATGAGRAATPRAAAVATRTAARAPADRDTRVAARPDRGYPLASGERPDDSLRQSRGGAVLAGAGNRDGARERAASERGRSSMKNAPRPSAQRDAKGSGQPRRESAAPRTQPRQHRGDRQ